MHCSCLMLDPADNSFTQFDSSRTGQLSSYDLQRLLEKDATMEAREDCVKMVSAVTWLSLSVQHSYSGHRASS